MPWLIGRGAGRFFWKGQTLFRPSQDCSGRYGSAIVINRVDRLSSDAFQETVVGRVESHWRSRLTGTHTLNSCAGPTVIVFPAPAREVLVLPFIRPEGSYIVRARRAKYVHDECACGFDLLA